MTARRITTALIIALLVSGLFTFWLSRRVAKNARVAAPQKQQYVAAAVNLDPGAVLKAENLRMVDWPASMPLDGGVTKMETVVGRAALYPLAEGQPILERNLSQPGAQVGLAGKIPEGMRAVSVRSDEVVGVAGFLVPGTHVDVLVTYRDEKAPQPVTATVLQDVEILTAGQQTQPDANFKPVTASVVTLLLKPEDAERLVLASSQGAIHFVLRNGTDRQQLANLPIGLEQLASASAPMKPNGYASRLVSAPKPKRYVVETILGDKQVVNSFN